MRSSDLLDRSGERPSTPSTSLMSARVARRSLASSPKWSAIALASAGDSAAGRGQQPQPLGVAGVSPCQAMPAHVVGDPRVVGDHQLEFVVDLAVDLVELQAQQPGVDAELDDHRLDLVGDAVHHLAALHHGGDVADGDHVLELERGEVAERVVEAGLVALERLQRLVGAVEQSADVLQLVLAAAGVDVDDAHLLADADTTGTSSERATRSAVRCRVPVSLVGTVGSGTRWTLARAMRPPSSREMIAPSILANSDSRCGLNGASTRNPPQQIANTSAPSPRMNRAPVLARTTRSIPSRSGVPGATGASASRKA